MKENNPSKEEDFSGENECLEFYPSSGNNRNLCFVQLSGDSIFLNYSYLVSGEFLREEGQINLSYTTHMVTITGKNIEKLLEDLFSNTLKKIQCSDSRYAEIMDDEKLRVMGILVKKQSITT